MCVDPVTQQLPETLVSVPLWSSSYPTIDELLFLSIVQTEF